MPELKIAFFVVDLVWSHQSEIKGVGWDMGVTSRVVGFRTGVWNFTGAGLGSLGGILIVKCQHR